MATAVKRALKGFQLGWEVRSRFGGLLARRKGFQAGWTARGLKAERLALRKARTGEWLRGVKKAAGWTAVLAMIGGVVLTATMGDEIGRMIGEKSA